MSTSRPAGQPVVLDPASLRRLSWAFGVTQIVSWGSLFYAIGVLGKSIRAELGISEPMLFGAVSAALLINGLGAPFVGRHIDRYGGRRLMAIGSVVAAVAFAIIGLAHNQAMYFAGWVVAGVAMPMVFYDPAFATVTRHSGGSYRRALTMITLFGGLAGTIFWPLTSTLHDALGWRGPWGTTYASNLRLFMQGIDEQQWLRLARTLETRPPMPWFNLRRMSEADLRAIYETGTGSVRAREILNNWGVWRKKFVKVFPHEYRRALAEIHARGKTGAGESPIPDITQQVAATAVEMKSAGGPAKKPAARKPAARKPAASKKSTGKAE